MVSSWETPWVREEGDPLMDRRGAPAGGMEDAGHADGTPDDGTTDLNEGRVDGPWRDGEMATDTVGENSGPLLSGADMTWTTGDGDRDDLLSDVLTRWWRSAEVAEWGRMGCAGEAHARACSSESSTGAGQRRKAACGQR